MMNELRAQDDVLGNMYDELMVLDAEVQASIEGFISGFERMVNEAGSVGKGCRATISKALDGARMGFWLMMWC